MSNCLDEPLTLRRIDGEKVFLQAVSATPRSIANFVGCMDLFGGPPRLFDEVAPDHFCWVEEAFLLTSCPGAPLAGEFRLKGFPAGATLEFVHRNFVRCGESLLEDLVRHESRHGPTQKAKHRLVNNLAFIFDSFAAPENEEGRPVLRTEFVASALTVVGIQNANPEKLRHKSTSRLARELPEPFTPEMARRRTRLYKRIVTAAEAKGQSVEAFLTEKPTCYSEYRNAGPKVKKS